MPTTDPPAAPLPASFDAVVVGASLGGLDVLELLLAALPADFPAPILVAHHVAEQSPGYVPALLGRRTRLAVRHAVPGEPLRPASVLLAPPGRHLLVARDAHGVHRAALSDGPRVNYVRPSADLLFRSAAEWLGPRVLGVVLTGRLRDGAAGAAAIREAGGVVVAQDPATCRAPGMPTAAIQGGSAHFVLPPSRLAGALVALVTTAGRPAAFDLQGHAA